MKLKELESLASEVDVRNILVKPEDVMLNMEGKGDLEAKPPKLNIPSRLFGIALVVFLISVFAGGSAFWAWQKGYHYEYWFADDYGALQVTIKISKQSKQLNNIFLKTTLFSENSGKLTEQNDAIFRYKQDKEGKGKYSGTLTSEKVYLKTGSYLFLVYIENEQYRQNFYLAPRSFQKHQHDVMDAHHISITTGTPPQLPVKLIYKLSDNQTGLALPDQNSAVAIFSDNKWINWQEYIQNKNQLQQFRSGNRFRFRFKHEGYYTAFSNVTIQPEQNILKLDLNLTPLIGELLIKSNPPGLDIRINNSTTYISGGKNPRFKPLPTLLNSYQKLTLAPGEYFLTALNRRLFFNATSSTQKLTVKSGAKTYADLSIDPQDQSVNISIK
ncbi:MAG: hypothetical protein HQ517_16875 [SAR324 cluster bacterium]|nr:hypothetical protein [SAR324 cluster bacterium]